MRGSWSITDGVVEIRAPAPGDAASLIAGRDEEFERWLGPGSSEPVPTACIIVAGRVVGWVDFDLDRAWLAPGEVNIGYHLFGTVSGRGYATRAVMLLLQHLAVRTDHTVATVLIDPHNERSLALAARAGFERRGEVDGQVLLTRPVVEL